MEVAPWPVRRQPLPSNLAWTQGACHADVPVLSSGGRCLRRLLGADSTRAGDSDRGGRRENETHVNSRATVCLPTPGKPLIRMSAPGMVARSWGMSRAEVEAEGVGSWGDVNDETREEGGVRVG